MKAGTPLFQPNRLLCQVWERICYVHYSLSTQKTCLYWIRFFDPLARRCGQMLHPRSLGSPDVEVFPTILATERKVSTPYPPPSLERPVLWVPRSSGQCAAVDGRHAPHGAKITSASDVSTTMISTYALKMAAKGTTSPLDRLTA